MEGDWCVFALVDERAMSVRITMADIVRKDLG